jgi:3',5'-cyclic-AMP phosphodiesterase
MVFIVHLSDFHVGSMEFKEDLIMNAIKRINELNPDLAIITGDVTENGYHMEFERAAWFLDHIESPILVVPGNHDSRHLGNECFSELIKNNCETLSIKTKKINAIGLDSSEPDLDYGKVGRSQQKIMETELRKAGKKDLYKLIALHHHIIPVPKTGRERNVLTDAGDILKSVIDGKADFVLSGHKHVPYVWILEGTAFITAGTVSSLKLRGNDVPSFNTIDIKDDNIEIVLNQSDKKIKYMARYKRSR